MIKIAISGKAKSGKNTVAEILQSHLNMQTLLVAFADPIKEIAYQMFPTTIRDDLWGPSEKRELKVKNRNNGYYNFSYRDLLKDIGTFARQKDPDTWINIMLDTYKESFIQHDDVFIVTDLRYINEYAALKKEDFFFIRIKRDNLQLADSHASEAEQDSIPDSDFNYIVNNNYPSKKELASEIYNIIPLILANNK